MKVAFPPVKQIIKHIVLLRDPAISLRNPRHNFDFEGYERGGGQRKKEIRGEISEKGVREVRGRIESRRMKKRGEREESMRRKLEKYYFQRDKCIHL